MQRPSVLVIGGGIGGLTAAIALRRTGHCVTLIESDPSWSVYGAGIIQQANVVRAMDQLGVLDAFLEAASGFDAVEIFIPDGTRVTRVTSPSPVEGKPANVGIGRRALQKVLDDNAQALGAEMRLGVTADAFGDDGDRVEVRFSEGSSEAFDLMIGADGIYSQTRQMIQPDTPQPEFTGQPVWRYNFPRAVLKWTRCRSSTARPGEGAGADQRRHDVHVRDHARAGQSLL